MRSERKVIGIVEEALPATTFRVKISETQTILAYLSGKMRLYYIKIVPGDRVEVELSPYDDKRGRITKRF